MSDKSYWQRFTQARASRRRALAMAGTLAGSVAALSLIGCGDDDDDVSPTGGTSTGGGSPSTGAASPSTGATGATAGPGGAYTPVDTTGQEREGGTLLDFVTADADHFDPGISDRADVTPLTSVFTYPRLFSFILGKYPEVAGGGVEGEVAESFEISPDRLQITMKLRQGMAWDQREPTSGRPIDTEDIMATWNRYSELHPTAGGVTIDPDAPVESITTPDSSTIVMTLRQPDQTVLPTFADFTTFYVMPREAADETFDARQEIRGHGPWILEEYEPSVGFTFVRNPDYFRKNFIERMERPIVSEYAQQQAQFRAGNIHTSVYTPADVIVGMNDVPDAVALQVPAHERNGWTMVFGFDGDSPFKDQRVRQAVSMAIDREAFGEVVENVSTYADAGLDVDMVQNAVIWAGWTAYTLDQFDESSFGPNHKYLKYNPEEAKKLLTAAGYEDGLGVPFRNVVGRSGAAFERSAELMVALLNQEGFNLQHEPLTYQQFRDSYTRAYTFANYEESGQGYDGILWRTGRGWNSLGSQLFNLYHAVGRHGIWDAEAQTPHAGDPTMNRLIEEFKQEFDFEAGVDIIHEYIRHFAGQMHLIIKPTTSREFELWWPVIGNLGVHNTIPAGSEGFERRRHWWIDDTKPPLA